VKKRDEFSKVNDTKVRNSQSWGARGPFGGKDYNQSREWRH